MPRPRNAMEVFKWLDKSNCRKCGEKTCLAFAGAVFQGRRSISECPVLNPEIRKRFADAETGGNVAERNRDEAMAKLKAAFGGLDFAEAAARTGGRVEENRLILKILGKDFSVDRNGNLASDIHINPWVAVPFMMYILYGKGKPVTGNWLSFRDLKEGRERYGLFQKRCEEPMKQVADSYTELFDDMVHLFGGRQVPEQFESDVSVVLHPLPKVPIMVCYWSNEDGLESSLNLFFDESVNDNLDIGSVFSLAAGLAQMFQKLSLRHGIQAENA
ncbi:MAG: DUF3786 domain-containing protein [Thermodesulfobacteriota bacterium]